MSVPRARSSTMTCRKKLSDDLSVRTSLRGSDMNDEQPSALDIADQVQSAWSKFDAVPIEDMEYFTLGWGKRIEHLFVGVKPSDVDIDDEDFLIEMPLDELNPRAASAYLGPYLRAFLLDLAFQEKE